jgi:hypothetical protein
VQVWDGLHRTDLAGFLAVLVWSTGAQLTIAAAVRALDGAAGQAAVAARSEHAARERAATAEMIRAARHAGWLALQETAVPLVAALAAGTADPDEAQVRNSCAVQAARLRRLLAEGDEVPGSLVHELHASADVAERRGIAVEIATAGPLPHVPGPARRVITDAAIAILTAAPEGRIGLLNRIDALGELAAAHFAVAAATVLLGLFIIVIDCLPVLSKMMSGTTRYDRILEFRLRGAERMAAAAMKVTERQATSLDEIRLSKIESRANAELERIGGGSRL